MEQKQISNKKGIFINLTNHPSDVWDKKQLEAAKTYGNIIDIPFPDVPAASTKENIRKLCDNTVAEIMTYNPSVVLCQGEFTLAFKIINQLMDNNIPVVAACSERIAVVKGNKKESYFNFTQFREYER